ncbi:MAG TPA: DUF6072 family protein [Burkholderiaceae bacterium]
MSVETTEPEKSKDAEKMFGAGAKLLGEVVLTPGASLLLDGEIKSGMGHVLAGLVARTVLGVPGMILVAADSYSTSVTGKSLLAHIAGKEK